MPQWEQQEVCRGWNVSEPGACPAGQSLCQDPVGLACTFRGCEPLVAASNYPVQVELGGERVMRGGTGLFKCSSGSFLLAQQQPLLLERDPANLHTLAGQVGLLAQYGKLRNTIVSLDIALL